MRHGEPFDFKRKYASSNGPQIWEVIHDADKSEEDRLNPSTFIALMDSPYELQRLKRSGSLPLDGEPTELLHGMPGYLDAYSLLRHIAMETKEVWHIAMETKEVYEDFMESVLIPATGLLHPTYEAARFAIEVGNGNPTAQELMEIHERLARDERNSAWFWNAMSLGERHFDELKAAIILSRDAGRLPPNIMLNVDMLGGGLQGLTVFYKKDLEGSKELEDFWWTITDWDDPPIMGWYQTDDDGEFLWGEDGDCLISFDKPAWSKDETPWDLENATCIGTIVQTLEIIEAYRRANTH